MIPPSFDYHCPTSVSEAVSLLSKFGGEAKILAGGHSLLPMMKLRFAEPGGVAVLHEGDASFDLGALTGEAGFTKEQVGKISVMEMSTYIAVDRAIGREAVKRLNEGKVKGRKVKVRMLTTT